jgi:hypothetical protein
MTNLEKIHWAAKLVGLEKPNCLYIEFYTTNAYLVFAKDVEYDKLIEHQSELYKKRILILTNTGGLGIAAENLLENED